ncbi:Dam family site-specific DNA-(adenine-N6)-methyltransferase [Orbus wheelerorum]|uniref:DNA adenine methylase n=1 Tax=Orbus wheelerorum TaxID=3074111 RepID=UPI00370D8CA2
MRVEKSFLKWVGGKGRIMPQLLAHLPGGKRFIEPFVGAGNVFINTNYDSYIICDNNPDLINVYQWLYDDVALLVNKTEELFNSDLDYYEVRELFNSCYPLDLDSVEQAARFIWLMRHCFNSICRYNKNGKFNTPKGKHKNIYFPKVELINFSNKLNTNSVMMFSGHYYNAIGYAGDGDVIYCDPPYLSGNKNDSFVGYTAGGFNTILTEDLACQLHIAVKKGATAIISNSDNETTREIFKHFKIYSIDAPRTIAANGNRKPAKEIIGILTPDMI